MPRKTVRPPSACSSSSNIHRLQMAFPSNPMQKVPDSISASNPGPFGNPLMAPKLPRFAAPNGKPTRKRAMTVVEMPLHFLPPIAEEEKGLPCIHWQKVNGRVSKYPTQSRFSPKQGAEFSGLRAPKK